MIRLVPLIAALALAGCATNEAPEPEVRTVTVRVPVAVSCVPESLPGPPDYPDTDAALRQAPDAAARYGLIVAGRVLRIQRAAEAEPVIDGCR